MATMETGPYFVGTRLTDKLEAFLRTQPDTPFLTMDLEIIRRKYAELRACFSRATMHYAVKANDASAVLATLATCGASFDVGSRAELDRCLSQGIGADRIAFGHPIKKAADIAYAYARGVRCFGLDSEPELDKLAEFAPGAGVLCRLQTISEHADWPSSRKFGCARRDGAGVDRPQPRSRARSAGRRLPRRIAADRSVAMARAADGRGHPVSGGRTTGHRVVADRHRRRVPRPIPRPPRVARSLRRRHSSRARGCLRRVLSDGDDPAGPRTGG